jgi:hypothetical protein
MAEFSENAAKDGETNEDENHAPQIKKALVTNQGLTK